MSILNKFLLKSISEKIGRTLLLIISISLSAALLIGTFGASESMVNNITNVYKNSFGDYNIGLSSSDNEDPFFKMDEVESADLPTNTKMMNGEGQLANDSDVNITLYGMDLEDFKSFDVMQLISNNNMKALGINEVIISEKVSNEKGLTENDQFEVEILGKDHTFTVAGISIDKGLFMQDEKESFTVIASTKTISEIYNVEDSFTQVFLQVNGEDTIEWINDFNTENELNNITAFELYDNEAALSSVDMIRSAMIAIFGIVLIMSIFLINSSFNLIIMERQSVIGTFLSQGATRSKVIRMLLKESAVYGVIGGLIGCLLGMLFINILANVGNPLESQGIEIDVSYNINHFIIGFLFSLFLSIISSILPILKIRKYPIKEVILNSVSVKSENSIITFIIGAILIIISVILHFVGETNDYSLSLVSLFCMIIGIVLIIPKLIEYIMYQFVKLFRGFSGVLMVASNNLRSSKLLINNVRLLVIAIIAMLIISTLRISVVEEVLGAYKGLNYDVLVEDYSDQTEQTDLISSKIDELDNVTNVYKTTIINNAYVNDDKNDKLVLEGVTPQEWVGMNDYIRYDNETETLKKLEEEKNGIILAENRANANNIKVGDKFKISYNDNSVDLTVLGIVNSRMFYGGDYNLVNIDMLKESLGIQNPNNYYIQTSNTNSNAVKETLTEDFKETDTVVQTKKEMEEANQEGMTQITDLLQVFSYITVILGGIGVLSNLIISFVQRKKEIAVISVLGLSKSGRGTLVFVEGLFQATISLAIALISVIGINVLLTDFMKYLNVSLVLNYPTEMVIPAIVAVIMLAIITSIGTVIKSQKLSIINEIKYE